MNKFQIRKYYQYNVMTRVGISSSDFNILYNFFKTTKNLNPSQSLNRTSKRVILNLFECLKTVSDTKCILKKTAFLKIKTHEEIPKPRFFKEQNFTPEIMHHINTNIDIVYTNTIEIDGKLINIHFISETPVTPNHTNEYTKLIDILLKFLSQ